MRAHILASAIAFATLVSACGLKADETAEAAANGDAPEEATEVSINLGDEQGGVRITSDNDKGSVNLKLPGIDLDVKVPDIDIDAADVDIGGVAMYPGTKLKSFNIDAGKGSGSDKAVVRVGMTFPAAADTVADYYEAEMKKRSVAYARTGTALSGTTGDKDRFTLAIAPAGAASTGDLTIHESR